MHSRNNRGKRNFNKSDRSDFKPKRSNRDNNDSFKEERKFSNDRRGKGRDDRDEKPFWKKDKSEKPGKANRSYKDNDESFKGKRERSDKRREERRDEKPFWKKDKSEKPGRSNRPYRGNDESFKGKREHSDKGREERREGRGEKPFWKKDGFDKRDNSKRSYGDKNESFKEKRKYSDARGEEKKEERGGKPFFEKNKFNRDRREKGDAGEESSDEKKYSDNTRKRSNYGEEKKFRSKRGYEGRKRKTESASSESDGLIRLNKYLSNAGICSRREADDLIVSGVVSVNGKIVTEMGYKVSATDIVKYNGESLRREKMVYVLLNKPKDYITTLDDPRGRKTVLELVRKAGRERIYPVGRLDRNTTGVLLMTNDGELTAKLTHPRYGVKKIYHVTLDKNFKTTDFETLLEGVTLEDGFIKPDVVSYVNDGADKREVGIEIHSGKNRIVRRIFQHLGYEVIKLDRVFFAGLTKKDLPRGRWRFLNEKEVGFLKMLPK